MRNFFAAAALKAELLTKEEPRHEVEDVMNEDEAAEILEAMLGLAPPAETETAPKKRKKVGQKVRTF